MSKQDEKDLELSEQEKEELEAEQNPTLKKKPKKKKKKTNYEEIVRKFGLQYQITPQTLSNFPLSQDNSRIINLRSWNSKSLQTYPPSLHIYQLYPKDELLPKGKLLPYKGVLASRFEDQSFIDHDQILQEKIFCLRRAAEVHRQVRKYCQSVVQPGQKMTDIVKNIESTLAFIVDKEGLERGQAFPTGVSLNNVAAHYSPNYGDETILGKNDVCKIDFGVHVKGYLIDSAFTVAFDPKYDNLLKAVQDATITGLNAAGIDVRLCDVGEQIQEVMESYEIELDGKTTQIKCVQNLCGHTIERYHVHGGKSVPIVKGGPKTRMEEGEIYAIETFGSTGQGFVREDGECSHYMLKDESAENAMFKRPQTKQLLQLINQNFSTLAFCRRWIDDLGFTNHLLPLNELVQREIIEEYPPLVDNKKSFVAQYEHTVLLKPSGKEIMSVGEDY